jgi:CheY-like chemotaxis protein
MGKFGQVKALIVEDDENSARMLKDFLLAKGASAECVFNGEDAIDLAGRRSFDVIIVDLRLPGENGFVVTEKAKQLENEMPPFVIVVSAFADKQHRMRSLEAGADAFFSKPLDMQELLLVVKNFTLQRRKYIEKAFNILHDVARLGERLTRRDGHGELVASICRDLFESEKPSPLLLPLLIKAANLHDLALPYSAGNEGMHGEDAAALIKKAGLPFELQALVALHHFEQKEENWALPEYLGTLLNILRQAEKAAESRCPSL